jgi:DNA-binding beta-propeller fold protein YncE
MDADEPTDRKPIRGPHEVIVSPDGRTAYVSNFGPYGICPPGDTMCKTPGNTITVLDLAERKVKATYDYGSNKGQHGSVISRDGKYLWVTSETPQSLLEIDAATAEIVNQWMTKHERTTKSKGHGVMSRTSAFYFLG